MNAIDIIAKFGIAVISPLGTSLCLAVLALFLLLLKRRILASSCAGLAVLWLTFWSLPVASHWLQVRLEGEPGDALIAELPAVQAIVVLGGGVNPSQNPASRPNLTDSADRVWYAASLYHAGKAPLLILCGGSIPGRDVASEAASMRQLLLDFGVPENAMALEERSRSTQQNAEFAAELLQERGLDDILLVTSALHMPRALARFRAQGLQVSPAPTDFSARLMEGWRNWIPDTGALDASSRAIKELVGRAVGR